MDGPTLTHFFSWAVDAHARRRAIHFQGEDLSYRRVGDEARAVAGALVSWGFDHDDRAVILSPNTPEYITSYFGILLSGMSVTPVGVRLPSGDHAFLIRDSEAEVLFFHRELLPFVEAVREEIPGVTRFVCFRSGGEALPDWVTAYEDLVAKGSGQGPSVAVSRDDVALVMYTGGTTGRPRGVVQAHGPWTTSLVGLLGELGWRADDVACATGPLSHAAMLFVLPTFLKGGSVVIFKDFDPGYLIRLVAEQRITTVPVFPTMIYMLLDLEETRRTDFSSLRRLVYGGSPMAPDRLEESIAVFGDVFIQLYGQTESLSISRLMPEEHRVGTPAERARLASCGRPAIGTKIRLLGDDAREVAPGEPGEICVRSPYVMREYWKRPDETAEVFRGGWLHTGDIGRFDDDGFLYIVDRKKDMIVTGSYNVYSKEVEDTLSTHPAVAQVAVIGVPDPKWGEAVKACVVLRNGIEVSSGELVAWVEARKGAIQAPKSVDFLASMPLTGNLKPDKKVLRAPYWEGRERSIA